jgi:hypothetical protein
MWFEIAIVSGLFSVGNILFGHFEERTPKWRRLLKLIFFTGLFCAISYYAGRKWFYISIAISFLIPLIIHFWWLPKKGINGWTGEPKEKYYELRGWKNK